MPLVQAFSDLRQDPLVLVAGLREEKEGAPKKREGALVLQTFSASSASWEREVNTEASAITAGIAVCLKYK